MPADVRRVLAENDLISAYRERPDYQKKQYLAWIESASFSLIRRRRISQMLTELASGDRYMKETWSGAKPTDLES